MQTRDELLRFLTETEIFAPGMLPGQAHHMIRSVASNPETPCHILQRLADMTGQCDLLERVAENPSTPIEVLECLAHNSNPAVRAAVADNGNVRVQTLWELAHDENPQVRYEMAENPRVPNEILEVLSEDDNPYVYTRARETLHRIYDEQRSPNVFERVIDWVRGGRKIRRTS